MKRFVSMTAPAMAAVVLASSAPALAQQALPREVAEQQYQIATLERVLESAVEHGAEMFRNRLQALVPAEMLLSENARVRGHRLEGWGVFFDVAVPMLEGTLLWSFRTLDQNNLGLDSALDAIRSVVQKSGDDQLEQALRRIELQVAPTRTLAGPAIPAASAASVSARAVSGAAASAPDGAARAAPPRAVEDPILQDPEEAYRVEVREALIGAMLDHSSGLRLATGEMLTVAASGSGDRPRLAGADARGRTIVIDLRGADLSAFLAGQITRDEARRRMTVRVF
jgi:hypothetical protein